MQSSSSGSSRGFGRRIAQNDAAVAKGLSNLTQGVATAIDWTNGLVEVNVIGGTIRMPMIGDAPLVGFKVWIGYLAQQPICLGMVARSAEATVTVAAASGQVTVLADDGQTYKLSYIGTAPTVGTRVAILWGAGGVVLPGALSANPGTTIPNVPAPVEPQPKQFVFNPIDSGNWISSWTNGLDPWDSDNNDGTYFYGNTLPDSIPDSAVYVPGSLQVFLYEFYNAYPSSLAMLGRHSLGGKAGAPGTHDGFLIPDCRGGRWVSLPDGWEAGFRLGSELGVGFIRGHGYHKYYQAGVNNSGTIIGTWKVAA